jgi:putative thioredoxin
MNPHIIDVTMENAQQVLIEESQQRPVVIDFWSERSEPCKTLMIILEQLAVEYGGQFLLAKVNVDELQQVASQFGVRGLPTVMIMKDGQPIDGFSGPQTEETVREVLQKHLPPAWEALIEQANQLMQEDSFTDALALLRQAYSDSSEQASVGVGLAQVFLHLNRCDEAAEILAKVTMVDQDAAYEQAMAMLQLKRDAAQSPEIKALEEAHAATPDDLVVCHQLAVQYSQNDKMAEALELLLSILRKDMNFEDGAVKKTYTEILATLGKSDPLSIQYQRKMYTLLY